MFSNTSQHKQTLHTHITISYILVIISIAASTLFFYNQTKESQKLYRENEQLSVALDAIMDSRQVVTQATSYIKSALLADSSNRNLYLDKVQQQHSKQNIIYKRLNNKSIQHTHKQQIQQLLTYINTHLITPQNDAIEYLLTTQTKCFAPDKLMKCDSLTDAALYEINKVSTNLTLTIEQNRIDLQKSHKLITHLTIVFCALSIIIWSLHTFIIQQKIVRPIKQATETIKEFSRSGKIPKPQNSIYKEIDELTTEIKILTEKQNKQKDGLQQAYAMQAEKNMQLKAALNYISNSRGNYIKTNETKSSLFRIIAHDLRNPFNNMIGSIKHLKNGYHRYTDAQRLKFIENIDTTTQYAHDFLDKLLLWTKTQTTDFKINLKRIKLFDAIEAAIDYCDQAAQQKNITINNSVSEVVEIFADKEMLEIIIRNLLMNAVKFTYPSSEIRISAEQHDTSITVAVKDEGIGMDDKKLAVLFIMENQKTSRGTNNEKGNGLGLLICKELVEKHNGQIWVNSTVGKGSTFYFTLSHAQKDAPLTQQVNQTEMSEKKIYKTLLSELNIMDADLTTASWAHKAESINQKLMAAHKRMLAFHSFNKIKSIGEELHNHGKQEAVEPLTILGKTLIELCDNFEIAKIDAITDALPLAIKKIQQMYTHKNKQN